MRSLDVSPISSMEERALARPDLEYLPEGFIQEWVKLRSLDKSPRTVGLAIQKDRMTLLKIMNDADARLIFGTDSPQLFNVPGFSIHREMQLMREAGMSNYEVLRSATQRVGEYTGQACGVIEPEHCADLILLDENPLEDLANLRRLAGVIVRGRWLPSSEIQRNLKLIRNRPGNYRLRAGTQ